MSLTTNEYYKLITKTPSIVTNSPEILFSDPDLKKMLQQEASRGNFDSDVLEKYEEMEKNIKRQKVEEVHHYSIRHNSDGRYATNVLDETRPNKRRTITAYSERDLYVKLYDHYFPNQAPTLESIFDEWKALRDTEVDSETTHRNKNHWDKYYANSKIVRIALKKIERQDIEEFVYSIISDMTVKEFGNMRFVLDDMLEYAVTRHFIDKNPMTGIKFKTNKCKVAAEHKDENRIFMPHEKDLFFKQLELVVLNSPANIVVYAIYVLFELGLRVGEVVALKWEDILTDTGEIFIHRMEKKETKDGKTHSIVVNYTKKKSKYGIRKLPLNSNLIEIFRKVREVSLKYGYGEDGYVFCHDGGRITRRAVACLVEACCKRSGIEVKSPHDIRRTAASVLYSNGLKVKEIQRFLGHADMSTTLGYICNNTEDDEWYKKINAAKEGLFEIKSNKIIPVPQRTHERTHTYTSQNKIKIAKVQ